MRKRHFDPVEGVSNIELFYDLIFVYCISVLTAICHHVEGDFLDLSTWGFYLFSFLVVLQVWFDTTLLMNRYGDRSASDNVCLFVNMFLVYFLAYGFGTGWEGAFLTFDISWALILANLIVHWALKRLRYDNIDDVGRRIMDRTMVMLGVQLAMVVVAAFLPAEAGMAASVVALVVGLFLIYIYEHDNMIDHHKKTDGMGYMALTAWLILVIGHLTVALEYMPMEEVAFLPKSIMLTACLAAYLLTSFLLGRYNKPEFHYSGAYVAGRIGTCAFIVGAALATHFDPAVNLVLDTVAVYFALWHEWLLYHGRLSIVQFGRSLGMTEDDVRKGGYTFETLEGRRAIAEAVREARRDASGAEDAQEREAKRSARRSSPYGS